MSGEILLVNPRRRRKSKKSKARRRHSSARRRVSRHRRRRVHTARRVRRVRARRNPASLSMNGAVGTLKAGAFGAVGGILNDLAIGYGKNYLPAALASGLPLTGVKLASAVLVGFVSDKVLKGKGKDFAVGAATVALHDAFKAQLASMAPSLPLGDYIDFAGNPSNPSLLGYNPGEIVENLDTDEVGEYMNVGDVDEPF